MSNENLLAALRAARPDVALDELGVAAAVRRSPGALARVLAGAALEYGPGLFASRARLRYGFMRSGAMDRTARALVRRRAGAQARGLAFTLQTQSLFNAALPGVPNYVYTDHAALQTAAEGRAGPSEAWRRAERAIYHDAAHVFTFGSPTRDALVDGYGVPPDRVSVVGGGVRLPATVEAGPEAYGRRRVLFVGVEWERKGGPELLAAFRALRRRMPDATLTVAGCAPEIRDEGCEVLGRLPREAVDDLYRACSCFCMPSRVEPYGLVYAEAMSHARPVVATTVGAVRDIVADGETGHLVPPGDVDALAGALERVLGDPAHARALGLAGRARAGRFTWPAVAEAIAGRLPVPAPTAAPTAAPSPRR